MSVTKLHSNVQVRLPAADAATIKSARALVETGNARLEKMASGVASSLQLDFSKVEKNDLDAVAKLYSDGARRFDDFHAFTRYLQALGVQVGFEKSFGGPFIPRTKPVQFSTPIVEARYVPMAKAIQDIVGTITRLSAFTPKVEGASVSAEAQALVKAGKLPSIESARIWDAGKKLEGISNEVYPLFEELAAMLLHVDNSGDKAAKDLLPAITGSIDNLSDLHNRVFFAMTDYVEDAKSSLGQGLESPWPVFVQDAKSGKVEVEFRNTFRGEHLSADVRQTKLIEAWDKFINEKGGKYSDIVEITPAFLKGLNNGVLSEFVVTRDGTPVGTMNNKANHSLMAGRPDASGTPREQDVLTAGALRMWRDASGEIAMVVLAAKSGHFRPTLESLNAMKAALVKLGVPAERIFLSQGDVADSHVSGAIQLWNYKLENNGQNVPRDVGESMIFGPLKAYEKTVRADAQAHVAQLVAEGAKA
jgi:hypothetical protein